MKRFKNIFVLVLFASCQGQSQDKKTALVSSDTIKIPEAKPNKIKLFASENSDDKLPSKSTGTVSNGTLINGKLIPFSGDNFHYFDSLSYLKSRTFVNDRVKIAVLETYSQLKVEMPDRKFCIMECSNKNGGRISPHRTHQNGLSIDFMMPMLKDKKPYYGLDSLGGPHYLLEFDENGIYSKDSTVSIDFNLIAKHILILNKQAKKNKLRINKVIIKVELKDELFSTENGKELKKSGIYIVQQLTPLINSVHDDHYHIDFDVLK